MLKVIVVGSGFGGLKLVRELKNNKNIKVTLISDSLTFRYCPALYRTATGHRKRESIIPIGEIVNNYSNLTLTHAKIVKCERKMRTIWDNNGKSYSYDILVFCLGVTTSYYGIPGVQDHAYGIKSPQAIDRLKKHLHDQLTVQHQPDKNYVIVGGGPTGVELSAALSSYLKKIAKKHKTRRTKINLELIEACPRILPSLSPKASAKVTKRLRRLKIKTLVGKKVESESDQCLMVSGRQIPTHSVIWTAGITNNIFFARNKDQFVLNEHGKVIVSSNLQVDNNTFVIGDNAATKYSGLAQTAIHNAKYVAKAINAISSEKSYQPYKDVTPVSIIPVGPHWAVLERKSLIISGFFASILRSWADLIGYSDILGIKRAIKIWFFSRQLEEICPICKTKPTTSF